jgi:hypothetical protein
MCDGFLKLIMSAFLLLSFLYYYSWARYLVEEKNKKKSCPAPASLTKTQDAVAKTYIESFSDSLTSSIV